MTPTTSSPAVRIVTLGGAKARTNDNTGGPARELDKSPFPG